MYTTVNEDGILNNYANQSEMYYATYPSSKQQSHYALQGAVATLFVTALILVAFAAS
ncbi:MAG: ssl1498 family light-harvesting-like protein [Chlorogloeopsis fritschii C42_A2020_084]|uniref:photosystem II assembly protein Psb34 n=1 Tax=Chlorogloeopsis fritschii TaxID=1124 RepID=UPI001A02A090|nr:ssl1498 family light-harvesting-like protein [Chlorogloeopsis fritschii]MBF2006846.1 ssl1498 family light-harvesting-like protein [Chlorogloeopsis fritschii C42_A2020_084]